MKYKKGQILNFSWNNKYGKLIKLNNWITYGYSPVNKWTHTAIVGNITKDGVVVYEALKGGFTKNIYSQKQLDSWVDNGNMIIGEVDFKLSKITENCDKYIGTPYGFFDIFNIGLYVFFRQFMPTIPTGARSIICSEAVARILYESSDKKLNFETEFNKRYDLITPINLYYSKQIKWNK